MDTPKKTHSTDLDQAGDTGQESVVASWKTAYFWKGVVVLVIWFLFYFIALEWIMTSPLVPIWVKEMLTPKGLPVFPSR